MQEVYEWFMHVLLRGVLRVTLDRKVSDENRHNLNLGSLKDNLGKLGEGV